jgi:site-specific recombinase XerD
MKHTSEISTCGLIENHLASFFGSRDMREIREADLLLFTKAKLDTGLSPKAVKNALSVLRRVYYLAEREGLVEQNPAAHCGELMQRVGRRMSTEVTDAQTWTRDEVERLLALAQDHEARIYLYVVEVFRTEGAFC